MNWSILLRRDSIEEKIYEIDLQAALELVNSNKSIFVWIGGWSNVPLADLLQIDGEKVIEANPFELLDKEKYPKALQEYEKPIFVCHHGAASYELVRELEHDNIQGYSLMGGIEGIKGKI